MECQEIFRSVKSIWTVPTQRLPFWERDREPPIAVMRPPKKVKRSLVRSRLALAQPLLPTENDRELFVMLQTSLKVSRKSSRF